MQPLTLTLSLSVATAMVAPHQPPAVSKRQPLADVHAIHSANLVVDSGDLADAAPQEVQRWKSDCFMRVPTYALLQSENPGAGMHPDDIKPYTTVLKDGFMMVDCVKDSMYEHGDKFGNNKFAYRMGPIANSSIVHYTEIVPKEDRKKMTPSVCFEFCRSVKDMGFFGISNGRDCYCTPYYKAMASDSSECDSVCEGDTGKMCGGKSKNSIFEMHMCDTTAEDLKKASKEADAVEHHMKQVCDDMDRVADGVEHAAQTMQKAFGKIGDPSAANQMQAANVHAGEWIHAADECLDFATDVKSLVKKTAAHDKKDLKKYKNRKAAEDHTKELEEAVEKGTDILRGQVEKWQEAQPSKGTATEQANKFLPKVLDQYYSIMYFIDDKYADDSSVPVTCDGDLIGEPILGYDPGHCAVACDDRVGECVGFAAYELLNDKRSHAVICFLFSKFKTAQYYTGCDKKTKFLQQQITHQSQQNIIDGFVTHHKHEIHLNFTAQQKAECAKRSASKTCKQAREQIKGGNADACYLTPGNKWVFSDLPGYFDCLNACCEDYDPNLMLDGLTCENLISYYPKGTACDTALEVQNPPVGSKIKTVCPKSCSICDKPVTTLPTTSKAPVPPFSTAAPPVVPKETMKVAQKTNLKAMCRAKFSLFGSISLKPDESGKSKYALKELTKADRCFK